MKSFKGSYCIIYYSEAAFGVHIGRFGLVSVPPGSIAYCGSAFGQGGVPLRVCRHLSPQTNKHWHIDYITPYLTPVRVWTVRGMNIECAAAGILSEMKTADRVIKGFGSSDCTCDSHLYRFIKRPKFTHFKKELKKIYPDVTVVSRRVEEFVCQTS